MPGSNLYKAVLPTLIAAFMLSMLPLPDWAEHWRPDWVTLVLIYWVMALPNQVGVTFAWITGLLLDVALGTILGQNAVGIALISWVVLLQYQRIRVFSLVQQALVVLTLLLIKQLLVLWINGLVGRAPDNLLMYFLPSLTGAMIWPWIFQVLRNIRRHFSVTSRL